MYTSHGHHIPNTFHDPMQDPIAERCGGVNSCKLCKTEVEQIEKALAEMEEIEQVHASNFCAVHNCTHNFDINCHS